MQKVASGIIHYINGTSDVIESYVAQTVYEQIRSNKIASSGIMNFDDCTIFVRHIKKIEWTFK